MAAGLAAALELCCFFAGAELFVAGALVELFFAGALADDLAATALAVATFLVCWACFFAGADVFFVAGAEFFLAAGAAFFLPPFFCCLQSSDVGAACDRLRIVANPRDASSSPRLERPRRVVVAATRLR